MSWVLTLALALAPPEGPVPVPTPSVGVVPASPPSSGEPPEPPPPSARELDAALASLPGPSLAEVQRAALEQAGLDRLGAANWLRRARSAAAAPVASVQYDHRLDRGWALDREAGEADALRDDSGQQGTIRAKLVWELDRLIFNVDELRAARASLDVAELRERVLVDVTHLYFERQRLLLTRALAPPVDIDGALELALRIAEVEGLLCGLTGLDFDPAVGPPLPGRV